MLQPEQRATLCRLARRLQQIGAGLSLLAGAAVGGAFALGARGSWGFAFSGFIGLLMLGMTVVIISAVSERVTPGDWRGGLRLSSRIFLMQTTIYVAMLLALAGLLFAALPDIASSDLVTLALQMTPGLYLCSIVAIILSTPIYMRWVPAPHER